MLGHGMFGCLPISGVRGQRDTVEADLAGLDGPNWLKALELFSREENTRLLEEPTTAHDPSTDP